MKRFAMTMLLVSFMTIMAACKGGSVTPKGAFENWMTAMKACDTTAIRAGITSDSLVKIEEVMKQAAAMMPADKAADFDVFKQMCKAPIFAATEVINEEITGDTAVVTIKSEGREQKLPMQREGGVWKMDFASLMKMGPAGGAPAAPSPATP